MKQTIAIALFVGMASAACNPWTDNNCNPNENDSNTEYYPNKYMAAWWMHGIMAFIQSIWMWVMFAMYKTQLGSIAVYIEPISWVVSGLNTLAFLPVGVFWILAGPGSRDNRKYRGWLIASNIYGWLLRIGNWFWWAFLFMYLLIFSADEVTYVDENGDTVPTSATIPEIGFGLEIIWAILWTIGYHKSLAIVNCYISENPNSAECDF